MLRLPRARRLRSLYRRRRAQGALLLFAAVLAALGALNGLGRADALVADRLLGWSGHAAPRDVVVVGIDDASLAALGRWPWPRAVHARLLDALTAAGTRAVGLDLMFSEPDPRGDAALAAAMQRNGRVVLPLRMAPLQSGDAMVSLPVPPLAAAAAGLGHLHVELDADGVARSIFLREGFGDVPWDHFASMLLQVAGEAAVLPVPARPAGAGTPGWWRREQAYPIPYAGPPGSVRRVSYLDVLEGRVPAAALRGAIVLVGATAPGLMDAYPTPVSNQDALMPGVEISAQALIALREGRALRAATAWEAALLTLGALALAAAALRHAPPWAAAGAMLALPPLVLCVAWALLQAGVQWKPGAALLGLLLLYPLWSWQRLDSALAFLAREFERTRRQLPAGQRRDEPAARGDLLDRRMAALSSAAAHVRALERQRQEALNFLSHDLRAPLSATLALIELRGPAHDAASLAAIERNARRALALADGFVQLARAESAQGYRMEPLDLRDPVVEGVDACWPQARARAVALRSEAPERDCVARGDRSMLTRAVVNLVDNALKHGAGAGAGVQCRLSACEAGWRIEVLDGGAPLQAEVADGLFTRFRRGKADADGAGLGLAFVQAVAQRHGGRAGWRAGAPGNVFFIELPAG
jgi:CHASE2 domain-containing sensor protein